MLGRGGKSTCADGSYCAESSNCDGLLSIRDARREGVEERPHHGREARRVLERGGHHVQRRLALLPLLVFEIGEHLARK